MKRSTGATAARGFSSVVMWTFIAIVLVPLFAGVMAVVLGPVPGYFLFAVTCILLLVTGNSARIARRRRVRIVLGYLETAVATNLPLSPILAAAARSETGGASRRLEQLRLALEDGAPMGNALLIAVPHAPRRIIDLVNAAEGSGRLPQVLPKLLETKPAGQQQQEARLGMYSVYALVLILAITAVTTMLTIFVLPKFMRIFHDFHTPVPALTIAVFSVGGTLAPVLCVITAIVLLIAEGRALRQILSSARPRINPLVELTDRLIWITPILGMAARDRGLADVFYVMAGALDAGRPAHEAVREATMPHLNAVLRRRIERWADAMAVGSSISDAAYAAQLPAMVCGLLLTGSRVGNLPQTLRFLGGHYESRFSRADLLLRGAAIPGAVLVLGTIVMAISLSMFQPIVDLMQVVEIKTKLW